MPPGPRAIANNTVIAGLVPAKQKIRPHIVELIIPVARAGNPLQFAASLP
jgi:hypothetical protein